MDELFGEVGFAAADLSTKARIEREIGLTALLGDGNASQTDDKAGSSAGQSNEPVEKR